MSEKQAREAAEKVIKNMAEVGEVFLFAASKGMDQREMFDTLRDALVRRGIPAQNAANIVRIMIEVASKKYLGKSQYGDKNVGRIIDLAFCIGGQQSENE